MCVWVIYVCELTRLFMCVWVIYVCEVTRLFTFLICCNVLLLRPLPPPLFYFLAHEMLCIYILKHCVYLYYSYVFIYIKCVRTRHTSDSYVHIYVYECYVSMCVFIIYESFSMNRIRMNTCMYVQICVYVYLSIYLFIYLCTHVHL